MEQRRLDGVEPDLIAAEIAATSSERRTAAPKRAKGGYWGVGWNAGTRNGECSCARTKSTCNVTLTLQKRLHLRMTSRLGSGMGGAVLVYMCV